MSKESLLNRISDKELSTDELTIKVDGAFYQIFSKQETLIQAIKNNINDIVPEQYSLFYLSDTSYSLPTRQYSVSFVVK